MKEQVIEIVDFQFKLKLKLLDEILEMIGDYRKDGKEYKYIAEKMGVSKSVISRLIKPDVIFVEGLKNSTLGNWLNNLNINK